MQQTPPATSSARLRIATRIHFALLRQYGEAVDVDDLLKDDASAREAIWVCQASGDAELMALARQFTQAAQAPKADRTVRETVASPKPAARASSRPAPQDAAWSRNTSGFGVSLPPGMVDVPEPKVGNTRWPNPMQWLRSGRDRSSR